MIPRSVIIFKNVRLVIKADKLLQQNGIVCKIIPVPTFISSECGMCIETAANDCSAITRLLTDKGFVFDIRVVD